MSKNLLRDIPAELPVELIETLVESEHVRVERIVSTGHCSEAEFWYDQQEVEWVVILQGEARLSFADDTGDIHLQPGDHVLIPPGRRHRVSWTTPDQPTIWLAVFFPDVVAPKK